MKKIYLISIILTSLTGLILLILYLINFHNGLSDNHGTWGEFGSFFGGVISPVVAILAFITVLYSFELTKEQFAKNNDNSTFFSLIELHGKKVESIKHTGFKKELDNYQAFKEYTNEYQKIIALELTRLARQLMAKDISNLNDRGFELLWKKLKMEFKTESPYTYSDNQKDKIIEYFNRTDDKWELIKCIIGPEQNTDIEDFDALESIGLLHILDSDSEERVKFIQIAHSYFYEEFGHILGHYFRNVHYILEHIDSINDSVKYSKIFRAQLSRYELALMFYNSLSLMSSKRHVDLLLKYDIFNGLYSSDLFYSPDKEKINKDLNFRLKMKNAP
jgi:hypothetical protein